MEKELAPELEGLKLDGNGVPMESTDGCGEIGTIMIDSLVMAAKGVEVVMGSSSMSLKDLTFGEELLTATKSTNFVIAMSVSPEEALAL